MEQTHRVLLAILLFFSCGQLSVAFGNDDGTLQRWNRSLYGLLVDHTANHGADRRFYSPTLGERRDLYVYLPPGFDPSQKYPVMLWLHGIIMDEHTFMQQSIIPIDRAISSGRLPPIIVVIPDGTVRGRAGLLSMHSSFLNTRLGCFADYLMEDVWNFVVANYPIRPEREAHIIAGVSMGGGSAFHHAIKHRDRFKIVFGIFPPLNIRWVDCRGRYFGNFDPCCWGWRTSVFCGHEPIGKFYGIIRIPLRRVVYPLYGRGQQAIARLIQDNPIEMLDFYDVQPGDLSMFVGYGGRDEFNLDAQIESFLYRARQRGLDVAVAYDPNGRHDLRTAQQFVPAIVDWLAPQIAPYSPPMVLDYVPGDGCGIGSGG